MSSQKKKDEVVVISDMTEFESFKRSSNRKIWVVMGFQFTVTFFALYLAAVGLVKPPAVIEVNDGRPVLFRDTTTPRMTMTDLRVKVFVREFLNRYVGIDSANAEEDVLEAFNAMTPQFRKLMENNSKFLANRRQMQFPEANLKTALNGVELFLGKYDSEDQGGQVKVVVTGLMSFGPKFGEIEKGEGGEASPPKSWFMSHLLLQRVPVTEISIHGLQVAAAQVEYFDSKEQMETKILQTN